MTERWRFTLSEREQLRTVLGQLLLGPAYKPEEPLIKQLAELRGQNGPIIGQRLGLLGFLASQTPETPEKEPEWAKMPEDYLGGPEGWAMLSEAEKRNIHEALKMGRKIYVAKQLEEGKRATLDGLTLEKMRLQKVLNTNW